MIVDTSAIMVLLLAEPEQSQFTRLLQVSPKRQMSSGSWIELAAVLFRRGDPSLSAKLDALLEAIPIKIAPVTPEQAEIGAEAYRRYGQGSGHPARLNFGDCFAYALSRTSGEPLLFKGDDFALTDVRAAA